MVRLHDGDDDANQSHKLAHQLQKVLLYASLLYLIVGN